MVTTEITDPDTHTIRRLDLQPRMLWLVVFRVSCLVFLHWFAGSLLLPFFDCRCIGT